MLHLLLHGLTGQKVDERLMQFLEVDERLVDIGDDLVDYEARTLCAASDRQHISGSATMPPEMSMHTD